MNILVLALLALGVFNKGYDCKHSDFVIINYVYDKEFKNELNRQIIFIDNKGYATGYIIFKDEPFIDTRMKRVYVRGYKDNYVVSYKSLQQRKTNYDYELKKRK